MIGKEMNKKLALLLYVLLSTSHHSIASQIKTASPAKKIALSVASFFAILHIGATVLEHTECPQNENNETCWKITDESDKQIFCSADGTVYKTVGDEAPLINDLRTQAQQTNSTIVPTVGTCIKCSDKQLIQCRDLFPKPHEQQYLGRRWSKYSKKWQNRSPISNPRFRVSNL